MSDEKDEDEEKKKRLFKNVPFFVTQEIILPAGYFNINLSAEKYENLRGHESVSIFCINNNVVYPIGTLATILSINRNILMVECIERVKLIRQGTSSCDVEILKDIGTIPASLYQDLIHSFRILLKSWTHKLPSLIRKEFLERLDEIPPEKLVYIIANILNCQHKDRQEIISQDDVSARAKKVLDLIKNESKSKRHIKNPGKDEDQRNDISDLKNRLENAQLTPEAKSVADQELSRLNSISPNQPEYTIIRTYLDLIAGLPWSVFSSKTPSFADAKQILNSGHYGMDKAKERALQYIAVKKLNKSRSPILCLAGPPGILFPNF
jgi:ATP-dependent Lon protease